VRPPNLLAYIAWRRVWEEEGYPLAALLERHGDVMRAVAFCRKHKITPPTMWLMELGIGEFGLVGKHDKDEVT
jgi:hypothetical protein